MVKEYDSLEFELNKRKSDSRVLSNLTLLGISFTLFGLIITLNPLLITQNLWLAYQLILSIPLFLSSTFSRSKLAYTTQASRWDKFGFITFILAYTFLINCVGILITNFVSSNVAITFFIVNLLCAYSYSAVRLSYDKSALGKRLFEDITFTILIVVLGIMPVLKII
jgi:hypothetical protein